MGSSKPRLALLHTWQSTQTEGWWRQQALMSDHYDEGRFAVLAVGQRLRKAYVANRKGEAPVSDFGNYQKHLRDAYGKVRPEQWVATVPDLTPHLQVYGETIAKLKQFADRYGAPIIFVTQPHVWSTHMDDATRAQIYAGFIGPYPQSAYTKWYKTSALEAGLDAYNKALLEKCRKEGLTCVDAANRLPKESKYFYDDFHFSSLGAEKLGAIVAEAAKAHLKECK